MKTADDAKKTQNCGVALHAMTRSFASRSDTRPSEGDVLYYGVIKDIIELQFRGGRTVVLFKCDWADNKKNVLDLKYGHTLIDLDHPVEGFVLPCQVMQSFYVKDTRDRIGVLPITIKHKGQHMCDDEPVEDERAYLEFLPNVVHNIEDISDDEIVED